MHHYPPQWHRCAAVAPESPTTEMKLHSENTFAPCPMPALDRQVGHISKAPLAIAVVAALGLAWGGSLQAAPRAEPLEFSAGFLVEGGGSIDLQKYVNGNPVAPGLYPVEILLNERMLERRDVRFVESDLLHVAQACLEPSLIAQLQLRDPDALLADSGASDCISLAAYIPGASVTFDSSELKLRISVPHAYLSRAVRGEVPTGSLDHGVTAGFIDYALSGRRSNDRTNVFASTHTGVNVGAWRLRHRASFSQDNAAGITRRSMQTLSSTVQRDLPGLNAQFLLGRSLTGGELFESVAFTGARVVTDERMLPDSMRGYAPVVRGTADTNARVSIQQGGFTIYEVSVAPGPFEITDLYPTNYGGDLVATVTEADGRQRTFNVAFAAVPQALRPGATRFSVTAGRLQSRGENERTDPLFFEGTYARGVNNGLTLLGGVTAAENYHAVLAGAAVNTRYGAFGTDITWSYAARAGVRRQLDNSLRVNYQRSIMRTGTSVGLASYRYSTSGYLTLNEAMRPSAPGALTGRARQRVELNASQQLGRFGTAFVTGGYVGYWDGNAPTVDYQVGYQGGFRSASVNLTALRTRQTSGRRDDQFSLTIGVPLGRARAAPRLNSTITSADAGNRVQLGVSGSAGQDSQLNYTATLANGGGSSGQYGHVSYQLPAVRLSANAGRTDGQTTLGLGAAGSIVAHRNGLTLGQSLGESFAIVSAPGAAGAKVGSGTVRVDRRGFALVPHLTAYRWNDVMVGLEGLPHDIELDRTSHRVAPSAGSALSVAFKTRNEASLYLLAHDDERQPLPFATPVNDEEGNVVGSVGQGSVIHITAPRKHGQLRVALAEGGWCAVGYAMPDRPDAHGFHWAQGTCQRASAMPTPNLMQEPNQPQPPEALRTAPQ